MRWWRSTCRCGGRRPHRARSDRRPSLSRYIRLSAVRWVNPRDAEMGGAMRSVLLLGAVTLLAACGSGPTCTSSNCATGCCIGDTCHTEFSDSTCSTGAATCVSCNTAVERCAPTTRACAPYITIRLDYERSTTSTCGGGGPCQVQTHAWASDYPSLASDDRASTCLKLLVQPATAGMPAVYKWSGCAYCDPLGICCATPWGGQPLVCSFVLPGTW